MKKTAHPRPAAGLRGWAVFYQQLPVGWLAAVGGRPCPFQHCSAEFHQIVATLSTLFSVQGLRPI
jgi:hypothetical protein